VSSAMKSSASKTWKLRATPGLPPKRSPPAGYIVLLSVVVAVLGLGFFLTLERLSAWYFDKAIVPAQQAELAEQESS